MQVAGLCVYVSLEGLSLSLRLCVCVYFDDPQSMMHSGKEKRRRKLLPHKVEAFQMYTDDF